MGRGAKWALAAVCGLPERSQGARMLPLSCRHDASQGAGGVLYAYPYRLWTRLIAIVVVSPSRRFVPDVL